MTVDINALVRACREHRDRLDETEETLNTLHARIMRIEEKLVDTVPAFVIEVSRATLFVNTDDLSTQSRRLLNITREMSETNLQLHEVEVRRSDIDLALAMELRSILYGALEEEKALPWNVLREVVRAALTKLKLRI